MATPEEVIHDLAVHHRLGLNRYSNATVRKVIAQLNRIEKSVVERLTATASDTVAGQRLEQLLSEIKAIQATGWLQIKGQVNDNVAELAGNEVAFAQRLVAVAPTPAGVMFTGAPALPQVIAAVNARPFQGRFLKDWLSEAETSVARRVRETIRQGFVEGRPTAEIVRQLRGTRAAQFKDGVLEGSRRGVEAMVRTAITHTANVAHQAVFEAHRDVVLGVIWTSTLDNRTSHVCISRSEKVYPIDSGPRPPAHINCRSVMRPQIAPIPGVVPFKPPSYAEWLAKQTVKTQDEILGPTRGALYRSGKVKVEKFVDNAGRTLSLAELRAKDDAAFEAAGLNHPMKPPRGQPKDEIARFLADPTAQRSLLDQLFGSASYAGSNINRAKEIAQVHGWTAEAHDLASIRLYTGSSYAQINRRMRESGGTLEDRQFSAMASRGVYELPDETKPVWRAPAKRADYAERLWETATAGEDLDLGNQLMSFTRNRQFAETWSSTNLLLKVEKPRHGAYIEPLSTNPGEDEVLFPLGLKYRVARKDEEQVNGRLVRVIVLEVVD